MKFTDDDIDKTFMIKKHIWSLWKKFSVVALKKDFVRLKEGFPIWGDGRYCKNSFYKFIEL